jgi:hypothetical protein
MGPVNIAASFAADGRPRPIAIFDFDTCPPLPPHGLQYVRASALAQARLQLAILGGNRRRALREIDRLVEIDRELARIAGPDQPAARTSLSGAELEAYLARQQSAIASEKLALVAGVEFPRLPEQDEERFEVTDAVVVEDTNVGRKLAFAGFWLAALILLGTALTIAIPALAASL